MQGEGASSKAHGGARTAKGQTHMGAGQVAQVARWLATLKASGCLCLLDGRGMAKGDRTILIQPPDYRCRAILVRHHYGDGRLWIVSVQCATSGDEFQEASLVIAITMLA